MREILTPVKAESIVHNNLYGLDHEECWAIYLSCANDVLATEMLSKGTLTQTSIDSRTVLRQALLHNAVAIIILHNHPYGSPRPSYEDVHFTNGLRKACQIMDINLVDHIIISSNSFYSFAEDQSYKIS